MIDLIREYLFLHQDKQYQSFQLKLCPQNKNIIGVRMAFLRKKSKELSKHDDVVSYLEMAKKSYTKDSYLEEIMIYGLTLGYLKYDIETLLTHIENFLPLIDNWAVCDSFCSNLKITPKYHKEIFSFLMEKISTDKPFYIRFSVVMMLNYYINVNYIEKILSVLDKINNQNYYVKMSVAWCISACYIKFPEHILCYLKSCNLDNFTYNKSLQKICESQKVTKNEKITVKSMKRK